MKIVQLIFSLTCGGTENLLIDIINSQVKVSDVTLIIVNDEVDSSLVTLLDNKVNIVFIGRQPSKLLKSIYSIIRLNILILKIAPDVIHCHVDTLILALFPFFWKKTCLTIHHTMFEKPMRFFFYLYNKIFVISEAVKREVMVNSNLRPVLIPNGVNLNSICKRSKTKISDPIKLLHVSRLDCDVKGQDILIEALYLFKQNNKNVNFSLDIWGAGSSKNYLSDLITQRQLDNEIKLKGAIDRDELYSVMSEYDIFILPSNSEGFGLVVAEAVAAKVPVVISSLKGPMDIVNNGEYGLIFEQGSISDLCEKIELCIRTYDDCLKKTDPAYCFLENNFSLKSTVSKYLASY